LDHENSLNGYCRIDNVTQELHAHFHHMHEIILVVEGAAEFLIGDAKYMASAPSIVFISSLENHVIKVLKHPYKRYVITVSEEYSLFAIKNPVLASILLNRPESFRHVLSPDADTCLTLEYLAKHLLLELNIRDDFWMTTTSSLLISMLVQLYRFNNDYFPVRQSSNAARIVLDIQQEVGEKCSEELSLDYFAKKHCVSKYYLCRIFKQISGYNLKNYIVLHRINEAQKLLVSSSEPISEIGFKVGYLNVNHFIRIFKQHTGTTPMQYRKRQG